MNVEDRLQQVAGDVTRTPMGELTRYTFRVPIDADPTAGLPMEQSVPSNMAVDGSRASGTIRTAYVARDAIGTYRDIGRAVRSVTDVPVAEVEPKEGLDGETYRPHIVFDSLSLEQVFTLIRDLAAGFADAIAERGPASDGSGVGFEAPDRASSADLFHVTLSRTAESIATDGLCRRSMNRTEKIARDAAGEMGNYEDNRAEPFEQEPRDVRADRRFDEIMLDARYRVDESLPAHESREAVFFWPTEAAALRTVDDGVVVAVDSAKLPDECRIVKGDIDVTDAIYREMWAATGPGAAPLDQRDEERLFEVAQDYWRDVVAYTPGDGNDPFDRAEVWMDCDVPPEAIEAIYEPGTDRVLYDPATADQRTLREFDR